MKQKLVFYVCSPLLFIKTYGASINYHIATSPLAIILYQTVISFGSSRHSVSNGLSVSSSVNFVSRRNIGSYGIVLMS